MQTEALRYKAKIEDLEKALAQRGQVSTVNQVYIHPMYNSLMKCIIFILLLGVLL